MSSPKPHTSPNGAPPKFKLRTGRGVPLDIVPIGVQKRWLTDAYVRLMGMKWRHLLLMFVIGFLSFNLLFAGLYSLIPGGLADSSSGRSVGTFLDAFFFSVQTVATIGYGVLYPKTISANILVTIEIMCGVIGFAMGNGLMFARFSRPTARIMFTKNAIVVPHNGVPTLMFRAVNQRHNLILEAHVRLAVTREETSSEGRVMRRFRDLEVERRDNLTFILSWTVMHPINEASPLYGLSAQDMIDQDIGIVIIMNGTDEGFGQSVYARHAYNAEDIVWNKQFQDIIGVTDDGRRTIDYRKFHELEPLS
jgi:inward rectifier potassium channel